MCVSCVSETAENARTENVGSSKMQSVAMVCRVENRVMGIGNCSIKMQGWKLWGHENAEPPNQTVRVENTRIKMLGSEMQD